MSENKPGEHSERGASGAERWINCPGSLALLAELRLPASDDTDYAAEGTAMHEATAVCLREGLDAWEICGQTYGGVTIDADQAEAIQTSVDVCRPLGGPRAEKFIEFKFSSPIHPDFYGTLDYGFVADSLLGIVDHKFGRGIAVEVENNPQLMYYAYGLLQHYPGVRRVSLRVCQPRAYHVDGQVRKWETSAEDIHEWVQNELLPAMTTSATDLQAGKWCQFCPAKLVCPVLSGLFETACTHNPKAIPSLTNVSLGRSYNLISAVKQYIAALEKETLRRLKSGEVVDGTKLVHKRARRVWKDGAEAALRARFGDLVIEPACLKSPAAVEEIHPDAAKFIQAFAFTPDSELTIAKDTDSRVGVTVQKPSEVWQDVAKALS